MSCHGRIADCKDATNGSFTGVQQFPRLPTPVGPDQSVELKGKGMITTLVATLCGEYRMRRVGRNLPNDRVSLEQAEPSHALLGGLGRLTHEHRFARLKPGPQCYFSVTMA
jgi:hypothetical protein